MLASCLLLLVTLGGYGSGPGQRLAPGPAPQPTRVAAASDLQFVLTELAERFTRERGHRVDLVFGSSGALARQIQQGAPFDLFLSADEALVERLAVAGLTRDTGVLYGVGRIVLFAPRQSPLVVAGGLDAVRALLVAGRPSRFAIASPEHAPYGRAAQAALQAHQLWTPLQPHLVYGENVSQAAQFATSGNAVGGIIAYSLALTPRLRARGQFALIPETDHPPLRQRMVLLKRAGPAATAFYAYLQLPAAQALLQQYGFERPR